MDGSSGVANSAFAIDYSSGDVILSRPMVIYVGGKGDLTVDTVGGQTVTFTNVPAGSYLRVLVTKIHDTSTASGLVGVYYSS